MPSPSPHHLQLLPASLQRLLTHKPSIRASIQTRRGCEMLLCDIILSRAFCSAFNRRLSLVFPRFPNPEITLGINSSVLPRVATRHLSQYARCAVSAAY